jgi:hypothetical protein
MNHWIDRFPPPLSENREVSDRAKLSARVHSCRRSLNRAPNVIAVEFYERGDIIAVVRELDRRGAVVAPSG